MRGFESHVLLNFLAGIAQLVEHLPCKQGVGGSSPLSSILGRIAQLGRALG